MPPHVFGSNFSFADFLWSLLRIEYKYKYSKYNINQCPLTLTCQCHSTSLADSIKKLICTFALFNNSKEYKYNYKYRKIIEIQPPTHTADVCLQLNFLICGYPQIRIWSWFPHESHFISGVYCIYTYMGNSLLVVKSMCGGLSRFDV